MPLTVGPGVGGGVPRELGLEGSGGMAFRRRVSLGGNFGSG